MFDKQRASFLTLAILFLLSLPLRGQQTDVPRFDVYGGYGFLNSPAVSLFEHGFVQTHEPLGLPMIFVLQAQHRLLGQRGTQQPQYARHRRSA